MLLPSVKGVGNHKVYRTTIRAVGMERSLRIIGVRELHARKTEYSVSVYLLLYRIIADSRIAGAQAREHKPQNKGQQHRSIWQLEISDRHARGFHHRLSFQPIASP